MAQQRREGSGVRRSWSACCSSCLEGCCFPEELPELANRISSFGSKTAEGIVLKNYNSGVFGKFINLEFQQKISDEALQGGVHPMRAGIRNFRR